MTDEQKRSGKSIVILGAGFGGLTAARELRAALPAEHSVTVIDRKSTYQMGLRKVWILAGLAKREEGVRRIDALKAHGIQVRTAEITAIDTAARVVKTGDGDVAWDYLIVALGCEARTDLVPGFSRDVHSLYDVADCERLAPKLKEFSKGRISVAVIGVPYPCPPAPYETAMTIDSELRKRGVREQVEIHAWTLQPMSLPLMGKAVCTDFEARLAKKGIVFTPSRKPAKLEGTKAVFDKDALESDILIIAPPHRPPAVVKQSGLTGAGEWIPVDRSTMKTAVSGVWAVGDCTEIALENKMSLPKAGIIAESQARVAAAGIVADINGTAGAAWEGKGYCFIEHGSGEAAKASFDMFGPGGPKMEMPPAGAEAYREKLEFETTRLKRWFE